MQEQRNSESVSDSDPVFTDSTTPHSPNLLSHLSSDPNGSLVMCQHIWELPAKINETDGCFCEMKLERSNIMATMTIVFSWCFSRDCNQNV